MSGLQRRKPLERRTPMSPGKGLSRGQGLRRTVRVYSDRRLAELPGEWAQRREVVAIAAERDGHRCQAQLVWPHDCWGGLEGHEPHKRSAGGDELDVDQVLTVCHFINQRVEAEPDWAREVGLSVHSWQTWSWDRDWRPT